MPADKSPSAHSPAAIEAAAAAWLARRDRGFTDDDAAEFALWRYADPRHAAAVARLEAAWHSLDRLRDFRPEARTHPDPDLLAQPRRAGAIAFPKLAAAALVATAAACALFFWSPSFIAPSASTVAGQAIVHPGSRPLPLEDGSVVELNKGAEIDVRFTATERRVSIRHGEALFRVAKNPARPFIVEAGTVTVRAVGTAFNVALGQSAVSVIVTEGRVRLGQTTVPAPTEPLGAAQPELVAGQQALIPTAAGSSESSAAVQISELTPDEMQQALAWQRIRLEFIELPLGEVVTEFNRYNHQKLVVADAATAAVLVGGNFRADNVDAFVRLLETGFDIAATARDGQIVLRKKR